MLFGYNVACAELPDGWVVTAYNKGGDATLDSDLSAAGQKTGDFKAMALTPDNPVEGYLVLADAAVTREYAGSVVVGPDGTRSCVLVASSDFNDIGLYREDESELEPGKPISDEQSPTDQDTEVPQDPKRDNPLPDNADEHVQDPADDPAPSAHEPSQDPADDPAPEPSQDSADDSAPGVPDSQEPNKYSHEYPKAPWTRLPTTGDTMGALIFVILAGLSLALGLMALRRRKGHDEYPCS